MGAAPGECRIRGVDLGDEEHAVRGFPLAGFVVLFGVRRAREGSVRCLGFRVRSGGNAQQAINRRVAHGSAVMRVVAAPALAINRHLTNVSILCCRLSTFDSRRNWTAGTYSWHRRDRVEPEYGKPASGRRKGSLVLCDEGALACE